jgi:hypothetical protein
VVQALFVHGTGVRKARHDVIVAQIKRGFERQPQSPVTVSSCYWGDAHGAKLFAAGVSIPSASKGRSGSSGGDPEDEYVAYWAALLSDPLAHLRLLSETAAKIRGSDAVRPPTYRPPGMAVLDRLSKIAPQGELAELLVDAELHDYTGDAVQALSQAPEARRACGAIEGEDGIGELTRAVAAALLAELIKFADNPPMTGEQRDRLVDHLAAELGGYGERGLASKSAKFLGAQSLNMTTQPLLRIFRQPMTGKAVPLLGDILHYQARGAGLRDFLAEQIKSIDDDVVLLGHSLGGVALVDLLAERRMPNVRLLVTVGSQAPFLHELGALQGLPAGCRSLPEHMPRWLNIYDRRDLLAYLAQPLFAAGGAQKSKRVVDFEVNSRQPFPLSHSAYWKIGMVYERICQEL